MSKRRDQIEFGDFQTPDVLARAIASRAARLGMRPASILEPTCGQGSLLRAALTEFPAARALGVEIDGRRLGAARAALSPAQRKCTRLLHADFFGLEWQAVLQSLPDPLLVIANPPWVTNATLSGLGSENLPVKDNSAGLRGIQALTGKSNFCISEWMVARMIEWLKDRRARLVVICKTSVARRVLLNAWRQGVRLGSASMFQIDAQHHFGARVDACALMVSSPHARAPARCATYENLSAQAPNRIFGWQDGGLVADLGAYARCRHLRSQTPGVWRSGIKHDCARVMELKGHDGQLVNGLNEVVDLEARHLYPLLKGADLAHGLRSPVSRWMLVPQKHPSADTSSIARLAPKTWRYLCAHARLLDRRASRIYLGRPRFSVFGVGRYSFSKWKVAIPGLYKNLEFAAVGPRRGSPVVFDDTAYFMPCRTRLAAKRLAELLRSPLARAFYSSLIFWDAKRPITSELLGSLDLDRLASELGQPLPRLGTE